MHPDFPALLEHLQAVEAATGVSVGRQATELLRDMGPGNPLRKDLIDIAVGFSSVSMLGLSMKLTAWSVSDEHGTRMIPKTVKVELVPEDEP